MKNALNVFFSIDKTFITHFAVTVTSLLETNKNISFTIYVIHDLDDLTSLKKLARFIRIRYGYIMQFLRIENSLFNHYKITFHFSRANYFRLLLADIIPSNVESGIYLDSDIVVNGSIDKLAELNFQMMNCKEINRDEYMVYAVHDNPLHDNIGRLNSMGFHTRKYFNSGVMLVNLRAWRENKVTESLLKFAETHMDKIIWVDQDVLNLYFLNNWGELDCTYNALYITKRSMTPPVIIHYAGSSKPWHFKNKHPYKYEYFHYLRLSKYKYFTPTMIFVYKKLIKIVSKTFSLNLNESI